MVTSIDNGTLTKATEDGNKVFYKANVKLSETSLQSKDEINVLRSVEVRILYEIKTYFK